MFNKQFLLVAHNMRSERLTVNFSVGRNCCDSIFVIRFVTCDTSGAGERERERERESIWRTGTLTGHGRVISEMRRPTEQPSAFKWQVLPSEISIASTR